MITYSEFKQLSNEEKRDSLTRLREERSVKDILEAWGITRPVYYALAHEIGLPLNRKGDVKQGKPKKHINRVQDLKAKYIETPHEDVEKSNFTLSLNTVGPVSIIKNILSSINDLHDKEVRVKMEVEVM